jgi:hypothetical protein
MEDQVCTETQHVTFNVEVSHPGIDGIWTFKKQHLKNDSKYKIVTKGKNHSLTVINTMKDEEGQYTFAAGEQTSSAKLTVSGKITLVQKVHYTVNIYTLWCKSSVGYYNNHSPTKSKNFLGQLPNWRK